MTVNPVFVNELRGSFFRRRPLLAFSIWIALTAFLMWLTQLLPSNLPLSMLPLFALPLIVPAFAAGTFAKEYEQQTWQDLYLTRLSNFQVVIGKFGAALLLSSTMMLCFVPAMILMQLNEHSNLVFTPGFWMISLLFKLGLSASLYVLLAMTCSRYSANRRTALVWCYVALSLYALMGFFVWQMVGQQVDQNQAYLNSVANGLGNNNEPVQPVTMDNMISPGFMGGIHLLFCMVVGVGTLILMWVSLSEQRGYKGGSGDEDKRAWQPVARRRAITRG
jgi:ABC-type transport system involved in multi-copper enzyme maturation permease subunit